MPVIQLGVRVEKFTADPQVQIGRKSGYQKVQRFLPEPSRFRREQPGSAFFYPSEFPDQTPGRKGIGGAIDLCKRGPNRPFRGVKVR
jgi:hypothetical protein